MIISYLVLLIIVPQGTYICAIGEGKRLPSGANSRRLWRRPWMAGEVGLQGDSVADFA